MIEIRSILCPIDFSDGSSRATDYAAGLAEKLGAQIHVLHVYTLPMLEPHQGRSPLSPELIAQMTDDAARGTTKIASGLKERGLEATPHVGDGAPYAEIVRFAKGLKVDLIAMGTHGRTGMNHLFLGSVAEKVCRLSPIPVLTVPLPKAV